MVLSPFGVGRSLPHLLKSRGVVPVFAPIGPPASTAVSYDDHPTVLSSDDLSAPLLSSAEAVLPPNKPPSAGIHPTDGLSSQPNADDLATAVMLLDRPYLRASAWFSVFFFAAFAILATVVAVVGLL